jgi:hypothetical protein
MNFVLEPYLSSCIPSVALHMNRFTSIIESWLLLSPTQLEIGDVLVSIDGRVVSDTQFGEISLFQRYSRMRVHSGRLHPLLLLQFPFLYGVLV